MSLLILPSLKSISFQHVKIVQDRLQNLAAMLTSDAKKPSYDEFTLHPSLKTASESSVLNWVFFLDLLNFSFWTKSTQIPFTVEFNGKMYTGYSSLCALFQKAMANNVSISSPQYLASEDFTMDIWQNICLSCTSTQMPLLSQRFDILKHAGKCITEKYKGCVSNIISKAAGDIYVLLDLLVSDFPSFRDVCFYDNNDRWFLKRAQIFIADLWSCFNGNGFGYFSNINEITMFADYRVPQSLVYFGILQYSDELINLLQSEETIQNGSIYEVEIRAASILAVDKLLENITGWNAILVDFFLWDYAKAHSDALAHIPIHHTRCCFY